MLTAIRACVFVVICPKECKAVVLTALAAQCRATTGDDDAATILERMANFWRRKSGEVCIKVQIDKNDSSSYGHVGYGGIPEPTD